MPIAKDLLEVLKDLTEDELKEFKCELCDRELEPRIRRCQVENKDRSDLVTLIISTHTNNAVPVTIRILESMSRNDLATDLKKKYNRGKHFIDVHRIALIERVTNTCAILDRLLDREVLTQSVYEEIKREGTDVCRMRKIFSGPMLSGGRKAKDALYEILESQEHLLMSELKDLRG